MTDRKMTPKATLRRHMEERHAKVRLCGRETFADLQHVHAEQHWRYVVDHGHGPNPNQGPGARPEGWYTGTDVVEWPGTQPRPRTRREAAEFTGR